jgi:hypothetical protein
MDLKEFIRESIVEIAAAICEADDEIKPRGGLVNPGANTLDTPTGPRSTSFVRPRTTLKFDIAVTSRDEKDIDGKISGRIAVISASIGSDSKSTSESASRLRFEIDVVFPADPEQKDRLGLVQNRK